MVIKKQKKSQSSQSQSAPKEKGVVDNFATSLDNLLNEFDINKYKTINNKNILIPEYDRLKERTHKGTNIIGNSQDQNIIVAGSSKEKEHLNIEQHMDHYTYIDATLRKAIIPSVKADDYRLFSDFLNKIRDYARDDLKKQLKIRYTPKDLKYKLTEKGNPTLDLDDFFIGREIRLNGNESFDKELKSKLYSTKNDQALISQMIGDFKELFEYHSKKNGLLYNPSKKGDFTGLPPAKIKNFLEDCKNRLGDQKFNNFIENLLYIDNFVPDEVNNQYGSWSNAKKNSNNKPGPKKDVEKTKDDFEKDIEKYKDNPEFQKAVKNLVYNLNIEQNNIQNNIQNNETNIDNSKSINIDIINSDKYSRRPVKGVIDAGTGYDLNKDNPKAIDFSITPFDPNSKSGYIPKPKENIEYNDNHDKLIDINKQMPFIPNERNEEDKMNSNNEDTINKELDLLQSENPDEIYEIEDKSQVHQDIYNLVNKDIERRETISESIEEVDPQYDLNDPETQKILKELEELDDADEMRKNEEAIDEIIQEQVDMLIPKNEDPKIKKLKKEIEGLENQDFNEESTGKYEVIGKNEDINENNILATQTDISKENTMTDIKKQYTKPEIKDRIEEKMEINEEDDVFTQFDFEYKHEEKLQEKLAEEKRIKEDLETTMNIIQNEKEMIDYINSQANPKIDTDIKNYKMENGLIIPAWYNSKKNTESLESKNIDHEIKVAEQEFKDVYKEDVEETSTEKYESVKETKNTAGDMLLEEELNKYLEEVEYVESDEELEEEHKEYLKYTGQISQLPDISDDELIVIADEEDLNDLDVENYNIKDVDKDQFNQIEEFNSEDVDQDQFVKKPYESNNEIKEAEVSETDLPEYDANKLDKEDPDSEDIKTETGRFNGILEDIFEFEDIENKSSDNTEYNQKLEQYNELDQKFNINGRLSGSDYRLYKQLESELEINKESDLPEYDANKLDKEDPKEVNQAHQDIANLVNADIQKRESTKDALDIIKENASLSWVQVYNNTVDVLNDIGVYSTECSINLEKITETTNKPLKDILANYDNIKLVDRLQDSIIKEQYDSLKDKVELSFTYDQLEEHIARYGVESGFYKDFKRGRLENLSDSLGNGTLRDIINSQIGNQDSEESNNETLESETNNYQSSKYSDDPEIAELEKELENLEKQDYNANEDEDLSRLRAEIEELEKLSPDYKSGDNNENQETPVDNVETDYQETPVDNDEITDNYQETHVDQTEESDPVNGNNEQTIEDQIHDEVVVEDEHNQNLADQVNEENVIDAEVEQPNQEVLDYIKQDYGYLVRNTGHMIKKLSRNGKVKYITESQEFIEKLADANVGESAINLKGYVESQMESLGKTNRPKKVESYLKEYILNRREDNGNGNNRFNYQENISEDFDVLNEYSKQLQSQMADMDNNNRALNYLTKINARNWFRSVEDHKNRAEKYFAKGKYQDAIDQLRTAIRKADKKQENAEDLRLQKAEYMVNSYDNIQDQLDLSTAVGELYKVAENTENVDKAVQAYMLLEQAYTNLKQSENAEIARETKEQLIDNAEMISYKIDDFNHLKNEINVYNRGPSEDAKDNLINNARYTDCLDHYRDIRDVISPALEELELTNRKEVYTAKNIEKIAKTESMRNLIEQYNNIVN